MRRRVWLISILVAAGCGSTGGMDPRGISAGGSGGGGEDGGGGGGGEGGSGGAGGSIPGPAHVVATPPELDFSWICAGGSAREALVVANRGGAAAEVVVSTGAPATVEPDAAGLAPLEELPLLVRIDPPGGAREGDASGVIRVHSPAGDVDVPWTARFTRTPRGRPAALCGSEVPCLDLDVGTAAVGEEIDASFEVVNDGCADLGVTALIARGPNGDPSPELRVLAPAVPFTLAPGERRSVRLAFGPTETGEQGGDVVIQTDTPSLDELHLPWSGSGR